MPRPTITDVADAAQISVTPVNRVPGGRQGVRRQTAEQVLQAADRIGYHGVGTIRHNLGTGHPARKFGFLMQQPCRALYRERGDILARTT